MGCKYDLRGFSHREVHTPRAYRDPWEHPKPDRGDECSTKEKQAGEERLLCKATNNKMYGQTIGHVGIIDCRLIQPIRAHACIRRGPLENEYGSIQTSHDFFLLWANHVVKLHTIHHKEVVRGDVGRTILGEHNGSCQSTDKDGTAAGRVLRVRCISDKCLY